MNDVTGLRRFVDGSSDPRSRAHWRAVHAHPIFDDAPGLTPNERHELTYSRLRHLVANGATVDRRFLSDRRALADVLGWAAAVDPSLFHAMNLHHCLFAGTIAATGEDPDAELARHRDVAGSFLMTEAGRASSHLAIATTARFDRDRREFVLSTPDRRATKFPTNAGHPSLRKTGVVFARLMVNDSDHGVFTFVTPLRTERGSPIGVHIRSTVETSGLPLDYATVSFDDVRLPFDAWMSDGARIDAAGVVHDPNGPPDARVRRALATAPTVWRAIVHAARATAQSAAAQAIRHAAGRPAAVGIGAGRPLLAHRAHQADVIGALADAYALTAVEAAVVADDGTDPGAVDGAWSAWSVVDRTLPLLKAASVDLASEVVDVCRERSGAIAMTGTDVLSRYRGLLHAYRTAGGDNTVTRWDIGRLLVESAEDEGAPGETWGPTAIAVRCERLLASRLRSAIRRDRAAGAGEFDVWDGRLDLVDALGRVHSDVAIMRAFDSAVDVVAGTAAERPLRDLAELHGNRWIARRSAILAELGLADAVVERARTRRHELCARLAPVAGDLADAFEMRDDVVRSVLASDDVVVSLVDGRP